MATHTAALASCPSSLTAPTDFGQASGATATSIPLQWTAVSGATSYNLTYGAGPTVVTDIHGTTYTINSLPANTVLVGAYLVAVSAGGSSTSSTPATLTSLPGQVGGVGTSAVTTGGVTVSWTTLTGAAATYSVYDGSSVVKAAGINGSSTVISGLTANASYSGWTVKAANAAGTGDASATFGFTTLGNAPSGLTVGTVTTSTAAFSWTAPSGGADHYALFNGPTQVAGPLSGTAYTVTTGLTANTAYSNWTLVAYNASNGASGASNAVAFSTLPVAPVLGVPTVTTTTAAFTWTGTADHFALFNGPTQVAGPLSGASYTATGLTSGTAYSNWTLLAYNAAGGASTASNARGFTTTLAFPTNVVATPGASSVVITWTASTGATSYRVYNASNVAQGASTSATTVTVTGLAGLTLFSNWYIVASGTGGPSAHSSPFSFTTIEPPFPVIQGTTTGKSGGGGYGVTSVTITYPGAYAAGDLLLITMFVEYGPVTPPTGWTVVNSYSGAYGNNVVIAKMADGSEGASGVFSFPSNSFQAAAWTASRITGARGIAGIATTAIYGSDNHPDPVSLTPSWGLKNTLWLAFAGWDGYYDFMYYPTGYTPQGLVTLRGANEAAVALASRTSRATSEDPGTFTLGLGEWWIATTVAIQPAP